MTLRSRLTVAFLAVVLGPVLLGAAFVGSTVATVSSERSAHRLDLAASAVHSAVGALCQQLRTTAEAVAVHPVEQRPALVADLAARDPATAVRILDADGDRVAATGGGPPPPWAECSGPPDGALGGALGGGAGYRGIAARVALRGPHGAAAGETLAVASLDEAFVGRLAAAAGADLTLLSGTGDPAGPPPTSVHSTDDAAGSSVAAAAPLAPGETAESEAGRWVRRLAPTDGQPLPLVLSTTRSGPQGLYAVLVAAVLSAGLLALAGAWWLARSTTRPLADLAHAADQAADGDLSARVPVRAGDETGRLAAAFNRMTQRTQAYVQALTASRDQLRGHLAVLGDTLSGTHDLDRILRVILQTALAATGARSGAVLLLDPGTGALVGQQAPHPPAPAAGRAGQGRAAEGQPAESGHTPLTVPLGAGLLGSIATTGEARRGRVATDGTVLDEAEPRCDTYVAVPISAPGGISPHAAQWPAPPAVRGVLALYDRHGGEEFDGTDLVMLRTFAGQAAVAVDNVRTHAEAQRLSLTDPLTGLWNYRYLKESMHREVERAGRFGRMLTVLALDLDRFKEVNDAYGHQAGDAVLVEFARRIRSEVREVDLAFRHGGEEFVVLLPETDARGGAIVARRLCDAVRHAPFLIIPRATAAVPSAGSGPGQTASTGSSGRTPAGSSAGPAATTGSPGEVRVDVTVSIGIAVYPDHALTAHAALDAADDALYAAKAAGRDTHRVATVASDQVAAAELRVRSGGRTPDDDLPRAGSGSGSGGWPVPPQSGPPSTYGGAKPPRQGRSR